MAVEGVLEAESSKIRCGGFAANVPESRPLCGRVVSVKKIVCALCVLKLRSVSRKSNCCQPAATSQCSCGRSDGVATFGPLESDSSERSSSSS